MIRMRARNNPKFGLPNHPPLRDCDIAITSLPEPPCPLSSHQPPCVGAPPNPSKAGLVGAGRTAGLAGIGIVTGLAGAGASGAACACGIDMRLAVVASAQPATPTRTFVPKVVMCIGSPPLKESGSYATPLSGNQQPEQM